MDPVTMTSAQILVRFNDVDVNEICLCDLDDSEFVTGGRVTDIVKELGYDESGRKCINDQRAWQMTIREWAETMGL